MKGDVLYPFEMLRDDIHRALDRDGQHDWGETARLADVIAPAVWNNAQFITEEHERAITADLRAALRELAPFAAEIEHEYALGREFRYQAVKGFIGWITDHRELLTE